jgi:hypothetical protein
LNNTENLDELEKVIAETDLKIYELSRIRETLQGLIADIQTLEMRFELVKCALATCRQPQRMEAHINV